MRVPGRASPLCSDRKIRTGPRMIVTKAGKPGSNRCSDSLMNPSRTYHSTARAASLTCRMGETFSSMRSPRLNAISSLRLPSSAGPRRGQVEHHGAGVAVGLLAALEALRELAAKGLELGELLIDRLDPLPEQARHATALARGPKLVVPRQLAYVLQRQTKGLSLANEEEPARVSIAVHPVS